MNLQRMRVLTFLFPLLSVLVSTGIVIHQYARRSCLQNEMVRTERQIAAIQKQNPRAAHDCSHMQEHGDCPMH